MAHVLVRNKVADFFFLDEVKRFPG